MGTAGSTCVMALARSASAGSGTSRPWRARRAAPWQPNSKHGGGEGGRARLRGGGGRGARRGPRLGAAEAAAAPAASAASAPGPGTAVGPGRPHRPPEGRVAAPAAGRARPGSCAPAPGSAPAAPGQRGGFRARPAAAALRRPPFTRLRERAPRGRAGAGPTLGTSAVISGIGSGAGSPHARPSGLRGRGAAPPRPGGRSAGDEG